MNDLESQIAEQNEAISSAMKETPSSLHDEEEPQQQRELSPTKKRNIQPNPRQQLDELIKKLQQQVNELTQQNTDLQAKLDESEEEKDEIAKALGITGDEIGAEEATHDLSSVAEKIQNMKESLNASNDALASLINEHKEIINQLADEDEDGSHSYLSPEEKSRLLEKLDELSRMIKSTDTEPEPSAIVESLKKMKKDLKEAEEKEAKARKVLNEVQQSVRRAQSLMGISNGKQDSKEEEDELEGFVKSAANLESQLMKFITSSAAEQSSNSKDLENQIRDQTDEIIQLKADCQALRIEKNAVLGVLGIHEDEDGNNIMNDDDYIISQADSPLFNQVQNMTFTLEDQLKQIDLLKKHLITAAKTIQQLAGERSSIMQALMPGAPSSFDSQTDRATRALFRNLEALGIQISKQNEDINSVISGEDLTLEASNDSSMQMPKSPRRE